MSISTTTLGRRIREYRRSQHQTQERFAEDLGVTRETVSRWETGREEPKLFFMHLLSKLLPPAMDASLTDALPADLQRADDETVRGLIDFSDNLDGLATFLDADFRVVRTTRRHQMRMGYDASEIYGKPSERSWSPDIARIIGEVGGLRRYRRSGIYCMDLALIRLPTNSYATNPNRMVTLGRTVAIGSPLDPRCDLTTLRVLDEGEERPLCVIKGGDGEIVLEAI